MSIKAFYHLIISLMKQSLLFSSILVSTLALGLSLGSADAARLYLEPAQGTFTKNCPFNVKVMMDTQDQDVKTIDVKLNFDREKISYVNMQNGAFSSYTTAVDRIAATGADTAGKPMIGFGAFTFTNAPLRGPAVEVASITLKSTPDAENGIVGFYALPGYAGDDSNIPQTADGQTVDTLNEAANALYGFVEGECPADQANIQAEEPSESATFNNPEVVFEQTDKLANAKPRYTARYIRIIIIIIIAGAVAIASNSTSSKKKK